MSGGARRWGRERERPLRIGHEQSMASRLVHAGIGEQPGEPVEQPPEAGPAAMDAVVATARGVHPKDDPFAVTILGHPADELHGPVRLVLPAERAVVLAIDAGRQ